MALTINTNIPSLNAQRNLTTSQGALATALQRLSSGLRINSARDDAAGLAISERLTTQIRGLDQARRNANDGVSLAQTAEGALTQTGEILQRIRELSIQSANATNSATDRKALNDEVNQLIQEVNRVANTTTFNGLKILDGTYQGQQFQVGANANETIGVSVQGATANDLKNNTIALQSAADNDGLGTVTTAANTAAAGNGVNAQTLTIAGASGSSAVSVAANDQASTIAASINAIVGSTGVAAKATTTATINTLSASGTLSFTINGGGTATSISAQVTTTDMTALAAAINDVSGKTGVTATLSADKTSVVVKQSEGKDITIEGFTNSAGGTIQVDGSATAATNEALTSGAADSARIAGEVTLNADQGFTAVSNGGTDVIINGATTTASSASLLSSVDISTVAGANSAIDIIDASLAQVSRMRASLGAIQNRFINTIANLQTTSENLSASRSRVRDADFAAETAALTRAQILQQAGTAVLAQANAIPNNVLSLLR
ncbi:MAG: flagellin [Burkholderiales bacterium]|jgi:flagellin|nr:flagellin [Burkholderiales bacterium]